MGNPQAGVNCNAALFSPTSSSSNVLIFNSYDKDKEFFTHAALPQLIPCTDDMSSSQITSRPTTRRLLPLEKKQCCSCGTFVTPVWRRHSYSSVLNLNSFPLTFDTYATSDEPHAPHDLDQNSHNILICSDYSAQKKYLCNACGIKYKKLNQSPPVASSHVFQKRRSLDYSVNVKPRAEIFSVYETNRENLLNTNIPILPIKSPKPVPKVRRPSTSFIFFCREYRKSLTKQNPSCSFGQISKILGEMWSSLPESHKQVCICVSH